MIEKQFGESWVKWKVNEGTSIYDLLKKFVKEGKIEAQWRDGAKEAFV